MNDPIGRLGSFNPARFRCIALTIFSIASCCPTTLSANSSRICNNFIPSVLAIRFTGTPVIIATTSATLSSSTTTRFSFNSFCQLSFSCSSWASNWRSLSRKAAATSKFCCLTASFFLFLISSTDLSNSSIT